MLITRISPFSGQSHTMDLPVTAAQLDAWHEGQLIQEAMGNLTASQREFVKTGITEAEWARMFGDD